MRHDDDVDMLRRRIAELELNAQAQAAELATAKTLLAATWPGHDIPAEPMPAELTHALHGPRQAVRLVIDGRPVWAGVRAKSTPDAARELAVWSAVIGFAKGER
ncbi:hypothetical protein [Actinomadura sp. DC4]|uniref:hypothetical protein n=1 Tax=Actinomadura sp. DC4 TaxID=3055069 RepID=UPI0025B010A4|nr:hypothetical protein [Actinomadura sp. DC4]MDN3356026.1 hypothetical protein [Actinomadura sp. DC4]